MNVLHAYPKIIAGGLFLLFFRDGNIPSPPSPASTPFPEEKGLFESDEVLNITLKGDLRALLNDRAGTTKAHSLVLSYNNETGSAVNLPVEMKTRGHFRKLRENCFYPPLSIQFPTEGPQLTTLFREQHKMKLVMPCKGDEYLVREWMVYKLYNLVTPLSFRARLVKVKLEDGKNKKPVEPFYGILLEEEKQMASRNRARPVEMKIKPQQTQIDAFFTLAFFEYLAGNTDWSVEYMQNIKLLVKDPQTPPLAVPYDFDHAGIVNAPYAHPAEELQMSSVRQRRYRGFCVGNMKVFDSVIVQYNQLKNELFQLVAGCSFLDEKYIHSTLQYMEEFYTTINDPKALQKEFGYPCDKNGTGNVVIKGLKED